MNLPNLITFGRLLTVPIAVYLLMQSAYLAAFILFLLAGVSDALDGYLAKRNNQTTELILFLVRLDVKMRPLVISKVNTAMQIGLAALVLAELGLRLDIMGLVEAMIYLAGVTTVVSGASYMVSWSRQMTRIEDDRPSARR